jgi:dephospho-CoA kinase
MVIGLTGGIGSGKSAAAACFAKSGFRIVDADQLAHQVLESADIVPQLRARWGDACLGLDGRPDRRWIATKVFQDEAERVFLEGLIHPEVARLRLLAVADRSVHHVVEIPLLFEKNLTDGFDAIVCVGCSEETRRARLLRRGLSAEDINRRINSQLPLSEKVKRSEFVLWNDGELDFLQEQVERLVTCLRGR